jgi:serine/threonine protein kinase
MNSKHIKCTFLPSSPIKITSFKLSEWCIKEKLYKDHYTDVTLYVHKKSKIQGALKLYMKKYMSPSELKRKKLDFKKEVEIHYIMDGLNYVLPLWFWFETKEYFGLMTKYMNNGYLLKNIYNYNCNSEKSIVLNIIYPLLKAVFYLHTNNIVHRDIKPANIFIHNSNLYLGDFGYSITLSKDEYCTDLAGTITYMAPELLYYYIGKTQVLKYKYEVDIWAIGIIVYETLFHLKPFGLTIYKNFSREDPSKGDFVAKCLKTELFIPENKISNEAEDFIRACLNKNPLNRQNIKQLINHRWIINYLKDIIDINTLVKNKCHSLDLDQICHFKPPIQKETSPKMNPSKIWCFKSRCYTS